MLLHSTNNFTVSGGTSIANFDSAGTTTFFDRFRRARRQRQSRLDGHCHDYFADHPAVAARQRADYECHAAGSISGTNISDSLKGTVIATFTIPANALLQRARRPSSPFRLRRTQTQGPTYTLTGGFTINWNAK